MTKDENDITAWNDAPLRGYTKCLILAQLYQKVWGGRLRDDSSSLKVREEAGLRQRDAYRDIVCYRANIERLEAAGHVDAPHGSLSAEQRLADWDAFVGCAKHALADFPPD